LSGITAVLTLSTIALDSRTGLPKVHYATALDWFIICSFLYCMFSLLAFAGVHYFTKVDKTGEYFLTHSYTSYQVGSGEVFSINEEPLDKAKEEEEWEDLDESSFSPSTKNEIKTVAAFNHVYGVKDYSHSSELQTKICYAHNSTNNSKYDKVRTSSGM
jgi:hypothetical protein